MIRARVARRLRELPHRLRGQLHLYGDTGRPVQAHLCPTDRCNMQCQQCDIWRISPGQELDTGEWKRVLDELADLAGPIALNFAGGEPFVREDIVELMAYGVRLGFSVSANTNGMLIDRSLARRLFDTGLDILYVSLDGGNAPTHDRLRNREGAFERVMGALDCLSQFPRPRVVIATILHRYSIPEVESLLEIIRKRDLQIVFQPLYQTFGQPYDPHWYQKSALLPNDLEQLDRALDRLISIRRRDGPVCNEVSQLEAFKGYFRAPTLPNGLRCKAGFRDIAFDPYGNVMVCYHLKPIGNLRDGHLRTLWWSREAARRRQEVARCPRTCNLQNCNFDAGGVGDRSTSF